MRAAATGEPRSMKHHTFITTSCPNEMFYHKSKSKQEVEKCLINITMTTKTKQSIRFDKIEIREFLVILSSNPSCHYGPSIELGWEYNSANTSDETFKVSQYEKLRGSKRRREKTEGGHPSCTYLKCNARLPFLFF
jgi:hypothetical protein